MALPELVSTLCTFLVLAPLALMPGLGAFLFRPMALAVAFAMIAAYILSRTFVPSRSAQWLKPHAHRGTSKRKVRSAGRSLGGRRVIDHGASSFTSRALDGVMRRPRTTIAVGFGLLAITSWSRSIPVIRREFFPEADAGAFEIDGPGSQRHPDRSHQPAD